MRRYVFVHRGPGGVEEIQVDLDGSRCVVVRGGREEGGELRRLPDGRTSFLLDGGRQICGRVRPVRDGEVEVAFGARRGVVALADPLHDRLAHDAVSAAGANAEEEIRALMPGRVLEVAVEPGQTVEAGELLLVLEAMKMQNEIRAPRGGRVSRVEARPGIAVEGGALLATLGPA